MIGIQKRAVFWTVSLILFSCAHAQEPEEVEIRVVELEVEGTFFTGTGMRLRLASDQYSDRIVLEESTNLVDWFPADPPTRIVEDGQVLFQEYGVTNKFFRGAFFLPEISLDRESLEVATGRQSPFVSIFVSDIDDFLLGQFTVTAESSNPDLIPVSGVELSGLVIASNLRVTPAFGGAGVVTITLNATSPDGLTAHTSLEVRVVDEGGIAPGFTELYDKILERKFPGLDHIFSTNSPVHRFSRMGEPGDWFYQPNTGEPDTAILGFTYDESENDFNVYTEIVRLTFLTNVSGNYEYVEVTNGVEQVVSNGAFNLDEFPFVGAGASPTEAAFARMAVGKNIINSAWTFDSATRFNYTEPGGSPEPGNWNYVKTGETTGRVTLTYDEDNNNASVYREEVDLTFETLESGEFIYREYEGSALNNTFPGAFDFSSNP